MDKGDLLGLSMASLIPQERILTPSPLCLGLVKLVSPVGARQLATPPAPRSTGSPTYRMQVGSIAGYKQARFPRLTWTGRTEYMSGTDDPGPSSAHHMGTQTPPFRPGKVGLA